MNYNNISFLINGNSQTLVPPFTLISQLDTKGKMKLNLEIYLFKEEIAKCNKLLEGLYNDLIDKYATKMLDAEGKPVLNTMTQRPMYEQEDTIINGESRKSPKMEDRTAFENDVKELFEQEVTFESKFTFDLLDGVRFKQEFLDGKEAIGVDEFTWLKVLNLIK